MTRVLSFTDCGVSYRAAPRDVTYKFIMAQFRVKEHPRVKTGLMEEEDCLRQFIDGLLDCLPKDGNNKGDRVVPINSFYEYYGNLSGGVTFVIILCL